MIMQVIFTYFLLEKSRSHDTEVEIRELRECFTILRRGTLYHDFNGARTKSIII